MAEWLPLAEGGDAVAQNSVGALYDHGLGVDEDDTAAVYWYQQAADQNLPLAMRNLASKYASGHGVPFDENLAEQWYEKAAKMGDPVAIKHMATLAPTSEFAAATAEPIAVPQDSEPASPAPAPEPMTVAGSSEPPESAPASTASGTGGDQPLQYGESGTSAAGSAAAQSASAGATPAAAQQAAVTQPPAGSDASNWLIGMWQGPSLGCPPGGGMEFTAGETHSYYNGQIAARLKADYKIDGNRIAVTTTGVDGVGHTYEYERTGPGVFVIKAVPSDMPSSMVGVEHRRCGLAPAGVMAAPAAAPVPVAPAPAEQAEAQPTPQAVPMKPVAEAAEPEPVAGAQQATAAPQASKPGSTQEGWDAFGRGDYEGALAIWRPLAETGDVTTQLLVGSIYDYGQGVPQDDAEAVKWYERAAMQGSAKGQFQAGAVYARSSQIKDPVEGYKWLTIAARTLQDGPKDGITADQALTLRTLIEGGMSQADIAKAKQEADAFKPAK